MEKKKISIIEFFKQVKMEVKKITWPSRQQVIATTILIIIVSLICAAFFFAVDQAVLWVLKKLYAIVG